MAKRETRPHGSLTLLRYQYVADGYGNDGLSDL